MVQGFWHDVQIEQSKTCYPSIGSKNIEGKSQIFNVVVRKRCS
jgi:hypothetical protein